MHYAVQTASAPAIKLLLLYNVDINLQDNVCTVYCTLDCSFQIRMVIDQFQPLQDGWTPLHLAVQARRTDIVTLLLLRGADKTIRNKVNIC